jgi:hypothetical protein
VVSDPVRGQGERPRPVLEVHETLHVQVTPLLVLRHIHSDTRGLENRDARQPGGRGRPENAPQVRPHRLVQGL